MQLVYNVKGYKMAGVWKYAEGSILTTEKPDDVDEPCGYIEDGVYKPFGRHDNKELPL